MYVLTRTYMCFLFQISTVKEAFIDISLPIIEERVSCYNHITGLSYTIPNLMSKQIKLHSYWGDDKIGFVFVHV